MASAPDSDVPSWIATKITALITDMFLLGRPTSLAPSRSLIEAGLIDSTGMLELVEAVERCFGICVDDSDLVPENFDCIDNIVRFVQRKLSSCRTDS